MAVPEYIRELSGKSDMIKVLNICSNKYVSIISLRYRSKHYM